ncbi:isochorismatase [Brevibacillus choshinensis]|uniref:isochorismatase n=1 Tax=Brevibacillus TaxID=55080 RepID=UPI002E1D7F3F|nr:isochorismatase [Brevibacillus choshinensis]MED4754974.1 isochorismatase [Brevibacillus choshinensis]
MIKIEESYKQRPIRFLELWDHSGWTLKIYGITYQGEFPRSNIIERAKLLACECLPRPAITENRYGVGFIGVHDGRGASFIFIDWWSDENELHHQVYVAPHDNPEEFTYVTPTGLIACVWDLRVLCFEREAWIQTVLANPNGPNVQEYLNLQLNEDT